VHHATFRLHCEICPRFRCRARMRTAAEDEQVIPLETASSWPRSASSPDHGRRRRCGRGSSGASAADGNAATGGLRVRSAAEGLLPCAA
jgi:hypothetical protein